MEFIKEVISKEDSRVTKLNLHNAFCSAMEHNNKIQIRSPRRSGKSSYIALIAAAFVKTGEQVTVVTEFNSVFIFNTIKTYLHGHDVTSNHDSTRLDDISSGGGVEIRNSNPDRFGNVILLDELDMIEELLESDKLMVSIGTPRETIARENVKLIRLIG